MLALAAGGASQSQVAVTKKSKEVRESNEAQEPQNDQWCSLQAKDVPKLQPKMAAEVEKGDLEISELKQLANES